MELQDAVGAVEQDAAEDRIPVDVLPERDRSVRKARRAKQFGSVRVCEGRVLVSGDILEVVCACISRGPGRVGIPKNSAIATGRAYSVHASLGNVMWFPSHPRETGAAPVPVSMPRMHCPGE